MSVALAIPVFNRYRFTRLCLESFLEHTDRSLLSYVAIYDNFSVDRSGIYAKRLAKRNGFAYFRGDFPGAWVGFDKMMKDIQKNHNILYVGKVDNDIMFTKPWLREVIDCFERDKTIGSIRYGQSSSRGGDKAINTQGISGYHGGLKIFRKELVVPIGLNGWAGSTTISDYILKKGLRVAEMEVGCINLSRKFPKLSQQYIEKKWQRNSSI